MAGAIARERRRDPRGEYRLARQRADYVRSGHVIVVRTGLRPSARAYLPVSSFWFSDGGALVLGPLMPDNLRFYLRGKSSSVWRYALSETMQALLGWVPGIPGIGMRAIAYKAI